MDDKPQSETGTPQVTPAPKKGLLLLLFNPETRLGRFNRRALQGLAVILSLFALGLLTGYLGLYQPAQRQIVQLQSTLKDAQSGSGALTTDLNTANQKAVTLAGENEALQKDLDAANQHIQVLQLLNGVRAARLALAANSAATARNELLESRNTLIKIAPLIDAYKAELSKNMQARFDLALGELDKDPMAASTDLDVLINYMVDMEKASFK